MRRLAASALLLIVFVGCVGASQDGVAETSQGSAEPSPSPTTEVETKVAKHTLYFSEPGVKAPVLHSLPYGKARRFLGGADVCTEDCDLPCPCTVPIGPGSFDIDAQGQVWVSDEAKGRIAAFSPDDEFLFKVNAAGNDYRNLDVQVVGGVPVVHRQRRDFAAQFFTIVDEEAGVLRTLFIDGEPYQGNSSFTEVDDRIFYTVMEPVGEIEAPWFPAEITLPEGRHKSFASETPGLPFLDGWLLDPSYLGPRVHVLEVRSEAQTWNLEINFRLERLKKGGRGRVGGNVSWEQVIGPDGVIHRLLFAGSYGNNREDGYWYLRIEPDGTVGEPLHLADPDPGPQKPSPSYQTRRLSLGPDGEPLIMWAGPKRARIVALPVP